MIIDCAFYRDGRRQQEGTMPLPEAAASRGQGGFVWLGMFEPGLAEVEEVRAAFGLHELAVEDAQKFHLRPKVEAYEGDVRLVICARPVTTTSGRRSTSGRSASSSPMGS